MRWKESLHRWNVGALALTAGLMLSAGATFAQAEPVTLVPYQDEDFGITAVIPEGWTLVSPGFFSRDAEDATDLAGVALQSAPLPADVLLEGLLPLLLLETAPEPVGEYVTDAFTWTLYQVDVTLPDALVRVDLALAHAEGVTYLLFLQARADEYEALHDAIFRPTLDVFAPFVPEAADVPYTVEEVTFASTADDVTLAGTLTLPEGEGPFPAVVLVTGSGPQTRDENVAGFRVFAVLADALTRAGVAVLRYDDRGVGLSTGTFSEAVIDDFAADARGALDYMAGRAEIDPARLGLIGHSEGGIVAALLADDAESPLRFIIPLAGPTVNGLEVLLLQNALILEAEGATQAQIDAQVAFLGELAPLILADDIEAAQALADAHARAQFASFTDEERAALGSEDLYVEAVISNLEAYWEGEWFASFLTLDPGESLRDLRVPALFVFGERDVQVDPEQSITALEAIIAEESLEDVTIVTIEEANHLFQTAETGSTSEYATLPREFAPTFIPTLLDWMTEQGILTQ
jgi:pimeloyl-ACP methyl ester carboxylesterase